MASRAAAKIFCFFFLQENDEILTKKKRMGKMKNKSSHSAVIKSPGRWTGNNIFFKGGLWVDDFGCRGTVRRFMSK